MRYAILEKLEKYCYLTSENMTFLYFPTFISGCAPPEKLEKHRKTGNSWFQQGLCARTSICNIFLSEWARVGQGQCWGDGQRRARRNRSGLSLGASGEGRIIWVRFAQLSRSIAKDWKCKALTAKNKQKRKIHIVQNVNTLSKTAISKCYEKDLLAQHLFMRQLFCIKIATTLSYSYRFCIAYMIKIILRIS